LTVTAAALTTITVAPAAPSIAKGTTQQFTAAGTLSNGTAATLTGVAWTSGTATVATIYGTSGLATAVGTGSSVITATSGGVSGTATLTVTAPTLQAITITPANPVVVAGSTAQLSAVGVNTDGSAATLAGVVWSPGTAGTATLSTTGLATGVAIGTETVTATSAGVTGTATLTVAPAEYAYVTNFGTGTVSEFTVGPGGVLTPLAAPNVSIAAGTQPYALAVDPTRNYLYVLNYNNDLVGSISEYSIGAGGVLTPLAAPNATIATGKGPNGLAINGTTLYVANYGDGTVGQYTIGAGGALTAAGPVVASSSLGTSPNVGSATITLNSAGTAAYLTNYVGTSVSVFSVAPGTGTLALTSTAAIPMGGNGPLSLLIDPTGAYAYVADFGTGNVSQFGIGVGGALTPLTPGLVNTGTGGNPRWLALDPTGKYIYMPDAALNEVKTLAIGTGGLLTVESAAAAVPAASLPDFIAIDPAGQFAYVADRGGTNSGLAPPFGNSVSQFSVGAGGTLVPLATTTITTGTGTGPASIAITTLP
jgi:6-phosphogluconolactonase